jgi:hypothetical protein
VNLLTLARATPKRRGEPAGRADQSAGEPGPRIGEVLDQRQEQEHDGGDRDSNAVVLIGRVSAPLGVAQHEPRGQAAEGDPVAAGGDQYSVAEGGLEAVGGEHSKGARADDQEDRRDRPEPRLDAGHEDRDGKTAGEQVADVVVDERRGEVAPPLAVDRADDRAEIEDRQVRRPLDDEQQGGRQDRGDRRHRAVGEHGEAVAALPAPLAPFGRSAPAPLAPALAHPHLVANALELRRPLAQAGAAVRTLGDVGADLGAAVLADDAELWGRRLHSPQVSRSRAATPRRALVPSPSWA